MSSASLPYTLLLLLVELAVGSLAMVTVFDARGQVTAGYVKAGALTILPLAVFALWAYLAMAPAAEVDGYRLADGWFGPFGLLLGAFTAAAAIHAAFALMQARQNAIRLGAIGSVVGAVAVCLLALLVAPPTWSAAGMVASALVSTAVLGTSLMAMMWGHWYLTSGRLPKEPMEQMALVALFALVAQAVLFVVGVVAPVREVPLSSGVEVAFFENPAFWLRAIVGLAFPIAVTWLAWRAARIRGMMSATGLLYIGLGAILAGEVLARGLLFSTGRVV